MYLRITKRTNKDGSVVEYFQFAHNERHPDTRKPVAKIIDNFGRVDQLDRQELVCLCQSIGRICGLRFDDLLATTQDSAAPVGLPADMRIKQTFGHAKEGNWAPQVVVALAVTRDGIPVRSWILPGNTADVTTVRQGSRRSARLESRPVDVCR